MKDLAAAYDAFMELKANLNEGAKVGLADDSNGINCLIMILELCFVVVVLRRLD